HRQPRPVTDVRLSDDARAVCSAALEPAQAALESGRGFVVLDGVPVGRYARDEMQAIYWLIGQLLGVPFEQNVQGTLLYDVRDTGQDVAAGARFSVTNYESSFHTDNSFGDDVLDYVGLLCLQTAKAGGLSQLISGYAVYHELQDYAADALATLCEPFPFERRGGIRPGEAPSAYHPIMSWTKN